MKKLFFVLIPLIMFGFSCVKDEDLREWIDMTTGAYTLTANKPVGLYVYGFSSYVSYAYTAGLDLTAINIQQ